MRKLLLAAAAGALFAGPSFAASYVGSTPGPDSSPPSGLLTIDFNGPVAGLSGNYQLVTGTTSSHAQPFGGTTQYLSVPATGSTGTATLDLTGYDFGGTVTGFSFYWGSIDTYNQLQILSSTGQTRGPPGDAPSAGPPKNRYPSTAAIRRLRPMAISRPRPTTAACSSRWRRANRSSR